MMEVFPMSKGVIYILTNPSFPDYIKIGYAKNLERRLQQLNRSEIVSHKAIADHLMDEISTFVKMNTEAEILDEQREIR